MTTEQDLLKRIECWQKEYCDAKTQEARDCAKNLLRYHRYLLARIRENQAKKGKKP